MRFAGGGGAAGGFDFECLYACQFGVEFLFFGERSFYLGGSCRRSLYARLSVCYRFSRGGGFGILCQQAVSLFIIGPQSGGFVLRANFCH